MNDLPQNPQSNIDAVMHSALDDYCKSRFISWLKWYEGDVIKALDKLKLIVRLLFYC